GRSYSLHSPQPRFDCCVELLVARTNCHKVHKTRVIQRIQQLGLESTWWLDDDNDTRRTARTGIQRQRGTPKYIRSSLITTFDGGTKQAVQPNQLFGQRTNIN